MRAEIRYQVGAPNDVWAGRVRQRPCVRASTRCDDGPTRAYKFSRSRQPLGDPVEPCDRASLRGENEDTGNVFPWVPAETYDALDRRAVRDKKRASPDGHTILRQAQPASASNLPGKNTFGRRVDVLIVLRLIRDPLSSHNACCERAVGLSRETKPSNAAPVQEPDGCMRKLVMEHGAVVVEILMKLRIEEGQRFDSTLPASGADARSL